jgi:16S rRNA (guanine1207-N2)-methyltransferase
MEPLSQLLERNAARLETGDAVLWINPPPDAPWQGLAAGQARLFCQDYRAATLLEAAGAEPIFGDFPQLDPGHNGPVILSLPHSKARLEMMLQCLAAQWPANARLWLAGELKAGIKSAKKPLARCFESVTKLDAARHCVLFEARGVLPAPAFTPQDWCRHWTISDVDPPLDLASWPGVFAHGRLDEATALLLGHLPEVEPGARALDFGTGCGVLGAWLARTHPQTRVLMTDSDALALRSARETLRRNGLQAEVQAAHGFERIEGRFDLIVSNPPFHQGHRAETRMSMQLLAPVLNFLNPRGQLLMVVNRHIPYRKWLDELFGRHEVLGSNARYHVLCARLPVQTTHST